MPNIICPECDFETPELNEMKEHILSTHSQYSPKDAAFYAVQWAEDAQERYEVEQALYNKDLKDYPSDRDPL